MRWLLNLLGLGDSPELAKAKSLMAQDQGDPRKRLVFGILAMSYEADPGYMPEHASTAIRQWYGIAGREELLSRIKGYLREDPDASGYDLFLATFLARAGEASGMLQAEMSWALATDAARLAQQRFSNWAGFGQAYLSGHLSYRQSCGDAPERLAEIRGNLSERIARNQAGLWASTPLQTALG